MKNKKKNRLLIFLHRTQMSLYFEATDKIQTWQFDPALIADLEIKDEEKFRSSIANFLTQLKLEGGQALIVLDTSVYFAQKMNPEVIAPVNESPNGVDPGENEKGLIEKVNYKEEEKLKFMHSMPFSNVFGIVLTFGKEDIIFGLNRDFYEPFIREFTERKYEVTYIYPVLALNDILSQGGLTPQTAEIIIQTADKYKVYNFLQAPLKKEVGSLPSTAVMPDNSERKRLYLLLGAFGVLLLLLAGVFFWARARDAASMPSTTTSAPPPAQEAPQVTPTTAAAASVSAELGGSADTASPDSTASASPAIRSTVVSIRNGTGSADEARLLQERLTAAGFGTVTVAEVTPQAASSTLVILKPTITNEVRQILQAELLNLGYQVSFQESTELPEDITINLTSQ